MKTLRPLALGATFLLSACALSAADSLSKITTFPCNQRTLFLRRDEGLWPTPQTGQSYEAQVFQFPEPTPEDPKGTPTPLFDSPVPASPEDRNTILKLILPTELPRGKQLRIVVNLGGKAFAAGELSTKGKATIQHLPLEPAPNRFDVTSETPLPAVQAGPSGQLKLVEVVTKKNVVQGPDGKPKEVPEVIRTHPVAVVSGQAADCDNNKTNLGFVVELLPGDALNPDSAGLRLTGLTDLFGNNVVPEGDIPVPTAPKGKEDAVAFFKLLFESAKGAPDAFSADVKVQPTFQAQGSWLFRPELTASIAKNVPKATNSIRLALDFSHTTAVQGHLLTDYTFLIGPSLEADRNFDRVNGLVDLRWVPGLSNLYHPREKRRFELARALGVDPKSVLTPRFGWGFETWLGLEGGGSISRQTIKNSTGTATLSIDRYDVLRLRPLLHAFFESRRYTIDVSSSLRYLFTDELSAEEQPDHTLVLRKVRDFRPYTEVTLSRAFDTAKHITLGVTYKNGSEPPLFQKVDKYSVGITVKF